MVARRGAPVMAHLLALCLGVFACSKAPPVSEGASAQKESKPEHEDAGKGSDDKNRERVQALIQKLATARPIGEGTHLTGLIPGLSGNDSARQLIEIGSPALPYLIQVLKKPSTVKPAAGRAWAG